MGVSCSFAEMGMVDVFLLLSFFFVVFTLWLSYKLSIN